MAYWQNKEAQICLLILLNGWYIIKYFDFFEDALNNELINYNKKNQIFNFLKNAGEILSYNTFNKKLKLIEQYLYFCSFDFSNPMYFSIAENKFPKFEKDVFYIHKMMFSYLHSHSFIDFEMNKQDPYNETPDFSWNIPYYFMPVFLSYFLSASKNYTLEDFFQDWEESLKKWIDVFSPLSNEMINIYNNWAERYLGQNYFKHLNQTYKQYSNTSCKKHFLQNSIQHISLLLAENAITCDPLPSFLTATLINFDKFLFANKGRLYDYEMDLPIASEYYFIKKYVYCLECLAQRLYRKIENNIKTNSKSNSSYKIAISNFEKISTQYKRNLNRISKIANLFKDDFRDFFENIYNNDPDISKGLKNGQITIHTKTQQTHINNSAEKIQNYYNSVINSFTIFISLQEKSCSSHPENYNILKLGDDYMQYLKHDIDTVLKNINSYASTFKKPPAILSAKIPGKIHSWKFPYQTWNFKDILTLIYSLSPKSNFIMPQTISNLITAKGFSFPLNSKQVASFLNDFDNILDNF